MAISLREQLIAAGFEPQQKKETKKPPRKPARKNTKNSKPRHTGATKTKQQKPASPAAEDQAIEQRKQLKAQIKLLIEENKLDDWKGEIAYRYLVDKRIRELYVNEKTQQALAARELSITRLNGATYMIPSAIALQIKEINPQWSVFNNEPIDENAEVESEEYADFKVPDNLTW